MKEFSVLISVYAREQSDYLRSALHSAVSYTHLTLPTILLV